MVQVKVVYFIKGRPTTLFYQAKQANLVTLIDSLNIVFEDDIDKIEIFYS